MCLTFLRKKNFKKTSRRSKLEEEPKVEFKVDAEDDVPPTATLLVGSSITPPPLSKSSSDSKTAAPVVANGTHEMPPLVSTFKVAGPSSVSSFPLFYLHGREIKRLNDNNEILFSNLNYLERCEKKRQVEVDANSSGIRRVERRIYDFDRDLNHEGAMDARPEDGIDVLATFGESQPPGPPSGS
nr:hypothetical protein [Tanacetum cinerariifolium]